MDSAKINDEVKAYLTENGISLYPYNKVAEGLERYSEYNILLDGDETSYFLWKTVKCQEIIAGNSPVPAMKAQKNDREIAGLPTGNAERRSGDGQVPEMAQTGCGGWWTD